MSKKSNPSDNKITLTQAQKAALGFLGVSAKAALDKPQEESPAPAEEEKPKVITNKRYLELVRECNRLINLFYNEGMSAVPDYVYDTLRLQITEYERLNPSEMDITSPNISGRQSFEAVGKENTLLVKNSEFLKVHKRPILKIEKMQTKAKMFGKLEGWFEDYGEGQIVVLEDKYIGIPLRVQYIDGVLNNVTPHDAALGLDFMFTISTLCPNTIALGGVVDIDGVLCFKPGGFDAYNVDRSNKVRDPITSSIAAVKSIVGEVAGCTVSARNFLSFVTYEVYSDTRVFKNAYSDKHDFLSDSQFHFTTKTVLCKESYEDLIDHFIRMHRRGRNNARGFELDGFVLKIDSSAIRQVIGETPVHPKWCFSYTHPFVEPTANVCGVEFEVTRTGQIVQVVKIDPKTVYGVNVTSAVVTNVSKSYRMDVRVGDSITLSRDFNAEMHVGYVAKRPPLPGPLTVFPAVCPSCGSATKADGTHLYCSNQSCIGVEVERILFAMKPGNLGINGISKDLLTRLNREFGVKTIADFLTLDASKYERMLEKGVALINITAIKSVVDDVVKKPIPLSQFIYILGIPGLGKTTATKLHTKLQSVGAFLELADPVIADQLNVLNHSQHTSKEISKFLSENIEWVVRLAKAFTVSGDTRALKNVVTNANFKDKVFVITGEHPESRATITAYINQLGGSTIGTVSKKVDYVIVGSNASASKLKAAKKSKVPQLDYTQFCALMADVDIS